MTSPDFDWTADDSIAVREQPAIAVYANNNGQVTLRRQGAWDDDDDCFIPIARENVLAIIGAILAAAGMDDVRLYRESPGGLCSDIDLPEPAQPRDRTAAERQRRHRAKLKERDSASENPVTDRDEAESALPLRLVAAE